MAPHHGCLCSDWVILHGNPSHLSNGLCRQLARQQGTLHGGQVFLEGEVTSHVEVFDCSSTA